MFRKPKKYELILEIIFGLFCVIVSIFEFILRDAPLIPLTWLLMGTLFFTAFLIDYKDFKK